MKLEFGRGFGRAAGLYRAYEKRADPNWRKRDDRREEAAEAAREEAAEEAAAKEAAARQQKQQKQQSDREQRGSRREHEQQRAEHVREERAAEGRSRCTEALDFERMRRPSWHQYEADFAVFRARALATGSFRVREIPLPPKGRVIEAAPDAEAWHRHMKQATLRWHPDKWVQLAARLTDPAERALLQQVTEGMFRAVTRAKLRGFAFDRLPAQSALWSPTE